MEDTKQEAGLGRLHDGHTGHRGKISDRGGILTERKHSDKPNIVAASGEKPSVMKSNENQALVSCFGRMLEYFG